MEMALAYIVDTLLFNLDKNHINGMVLVDYKKAFDMVDHGTLLCKLEAYKLDRNALLWFESYLTDRTQLVSFKVETSTMRSITAGVPQGSILGPLLFLLFINDLPLHVHTQLDMFADDTTLPTSSDCANVEELKNTLSSEVSNVNEWATNNKLPLNCSKTKTMLIDGLCLRKRLSNEGRKLEIELERSTLEQVENVKLLGLELDEELGFDIHIDSLCKKILKRISILNRIKTYLPRADRMLYYSSLIKPLILYCSVTWTSCCSHNNISKIFRLQKRARIILDAQQRHSTVDLVNTLG